MKASIAHAIRPTVLILGKDSRDSRWSEMDTMFAKAYQRFLGEVCQQCGGPKYVCNNSNNEIQFKLSPDYCASNAMVERKQHEDSKSDRKEFGTRYFGEPYLTPDAIAAGKELSDYRRPYLKEQAKLRGLIADDEDE